MIDILCLNFSDCSPKQFPQNPLTSYASYLKELYTSMSQSHTSQHWAHLPRCEFIRIAMIKNEEIRRGGPEEEMIRLAQQGKIETILSHKESIDLVDLFPSLRPLVVLPPPPPPGRVCLIEGAPGLGKSTFALHICHQWAQGASWLAKFDLVILAYLRDETIQNAITLADIIPARSTEMSQSTASQLQANDGMNVLFIFDGWDEFPPNKMKSSLVSTILRQPHKLSLHQSTVLITSRPVSTGNLLHIADRRVEILGFTRKQIREFIEKALDGNRTQIQQLVQHLEVHPVIEGYCYIPLHSAILVHIFLTMRGVLPTTRHELFCSFVLCCIVRECETHETDMVLPELSSFSDLSDDLKSKLNNLSLLAYNGIMQEKIIFYMKDLQKSYLPTNLPSLGLLQTIEGLALYGKSLSYNFLHLSIQELLAAYHISQMDSSEQLKVFKELFQSARFQAMLQYYCGFTKLDNPEIQKFISSHYRGRSSLSEFVPLLHCFYEAKQPSLSQLVDPTSFMSKHNSIEFFVPVDFLAVGYFIVSFLSTCGLESSTNNAPLTLCIGHSSRGIISDPVDDHCIKLLLNELSKSPLFEKLTLQLRRPSGSVMNCIAVYLNKFPLISQLTFNDVYLHTFLQEFVGEMLCTSNSIITKVRLTVEDYANVSIKCVYLNKPLTELDISSNHYCPSNKQELDRFLAKMIKENKSIKHLNLSQLSCEFTRIFESLQHNNTLVSLKLNENCYLSYETLAEMLRINKALTHLDLSQSSDSMACLIFESLRHNSTLVHLNLSNSDATFSNQKTAQALVAMLQVNKSLTHLNLSHFKIFSGSGACCVFKCLQQNNTLVNLNLSYTGVAVTDSDTAQALVTMLQVNKSLTHLNLAHLENFSDFGAFCVFKGLQRNTALINLNLGYCDVTITNPDTLTALTTLCQENDSLTHLNLSGNEALSDTGFQNIFECLQHNRALVYLNLGRTRLTATNQDTARSLTKMLQVNKSLTHLDLSCRDTLPANRVVSLVFSVLKHNTTLLHLVLRGREISKDDAECIAMTLQTNKSLETIDISRANVNRTDIILSALKFNTTLKIMCISYNRAADVAVGDLQKARKERGLPPIDIEFH